MPLFETYSEGQQFLWLIFRISEPLHFFTDRIMLSRGEKDEFTAISNDWRKLEWMASRYALHLATGQPERIPLTRDESGKLFLSSGDLKISISHSADHAAAIVSRKNCGIDIQYFNPKIEKLANRFLSDEEMAKVPKHDAVPYLTICWAIKEAAYKTFGKKGLSFKQDIHIHGLDPGNSRWNGAVRISVNETQTEYPASGKTFADFVLAATFDDS